MNPDPTLCWSNKSLLPSVEWRSRVVTDLRPKCPRPLKRPPQNRAWLAHFCRVGVKFEEEKS